MTPVALHALLVDVADVRDQPPAIAFELRNGPVVRGAQADRVHGDALEDGGELPRTSPHDAEDRGERGFARPRFRERPLEARRSAHLSPPECSHPTDHVPNPEVIIPA